MKKLHNKNTEELLIKAAYGDANFIERLKAKTIINNYPEFKSFYETHKKIASATHNLESISVPESIQAKIETLASSKKSILSQILAKLGMVIFMQPKLAFSSLVAVVMLTIISINYRTVQPVENLAALEARREAEMALIMVSDVLNKSTNHIRTIKLNKRVFGTIQKGWNIASDFYQLEDNKK